MLILTIRTDKPEAEVGLYDDRERLEYEIWQAHRELSVTIHQKIEKVLTAHARKLEELKGVVGFAGPGSFTGLRIGLTVANSLAYGLQIPIVGMRGEAWIESGITRLLADDHDDIALPEYGALVHITQQKK
jgi:tRNA threonylcarbamoyladenosine biosynthesis protein TsaB